MKKSRHTLGWTIERDDVVADYDVFCVRKIAARPPQSDDALDFHVVDGADSVTVIPITPDGRVILVNQYRQGIGQPSLEFPAGNIEGKEECEAAGLRELEEETGYRAKRQETIGKVFPDPALQRSTITIVAAYECVPSGERDQDEGEDVHTRLVTPEELNALIASGEIRFAVAIAAWHLFQFCRKQA